MSHTPTPWALKDDFDVVIGPAANPAVSPVATVHGTNALVDAAFIVRSVNAHDTLMDALRTISTDGTLNLAMARAVAIEALKATDR